VSLTSGFGLNRRTAFGIDARTSVQQRNNAKQHSPGAPYCEYEAQKKRCDADDERHHHNSRFLIGRSASKDQRTIVTCPGCGADMAMETLEGHLGTSVAIDLCPTCQLFWFDSQESLRLAPRAVLRLFHVIGERALERPTPPTGHLACPRCRLPLALTHDRQRNTPFQYLRCPRNHGRLISFVEFLREKNFIKPLSAEQIADLRASVPTVNCSNCGAPIDLAVSSACGHCGSPLSMLDVSQGGAIVAALHDADPTGRPIDPTLPLRLEQARREVDASFAAFHRGGWAQDVARGGLVGASLNALVRWLKNQERDEA
jgi:hypothetical protein